MNQIKKIWMDTVWSKVIAVIIVAIGQSICFIVWKNLLTIKIPLWLFIVTLFILLVLWLFQKHFIKRVSFCYDDKTIKLDQKNFEKIRIELLPQTGTISFLRGHCFAGVFALDDLKDLHKFEQECKKNDFDFFNPIFESRKLELLKLIEHFTLAIGANTFPHFISSRERMQRVPSEWAYEQPERFKTVVNDLNNTSDLICNKYDEFIWLGRRIFKI